ncbi:MAG: potassium channel family protein [Actinomycetota bacterium]
MQQLAVVLGVMMVLVALADILNTVVTTQTRRGRFWPTNVIYLRSWSVIRALVTRVESQSRREAIMGAFAPLSVLMLLCAWIVQQVIGFGLIWWGLGGVSGAATLGDEIYYSGVVYFTLGFGEIVPVDNIPRYGALVEAFCGVLTTALVIGYLPSLYSAYSERERKLMTLDDGNEGRITPTNLIMSRCPDGDTSDLSNFFKEWEEWIAGVIETHSTFPMLLLFRSKHPGQNWVTGLGLVADAALHAQLIEQTRNREAYWCLRRAIILFDQLTRGIDLSDYQAAWQQQVAEADTDAGEGVLRELYDDLQAHGFDLVAFDECRETMRTLRTPWAPQMEFLIDALVAPRGFWGHQVGHQLGVGRAVDPGETPTSRH